jgi:tRNA pseudouridine32 synthase/23S rRNA pseudouridine746 synthase/23S rRNA pseudouridine1911/1915/1917 synthase
MSKIKKIPSKYQPKGFKIIYEDDALIVGNKAAGYLTVGAKWEKVNTVQHALDMYVRKGNSKSHKVVYVVHRLDQHTSGLLIFAKTEEAQTRLKDDWKNTQKTYFSVVHGHLSQKSGMFESYLFEDDKYIVRVTQDPAQGKWAQTAYTIVKEVPKFSLVKIDLLTGRKNQIRVHFADAGHPVVGDERYGQNTTRYPFMALHSKAISFNHPMNRERLTFETELPEHFYQLIGR